MMFNLRKMSLYRIDYSKAKKKSLSS